MFLLKSTLFNPHRIQAHTKINKRTSKWTPFPSVPALLIDEARGMHEKKKVCTFGDNVLIYMYIQH